MKCKTCGHEIEKSKTVIVGDWEYQTETTQLNKTFQEIEIPKGWKLWETSDFDNFGEEEFGKLNLLNSRFFIPNPIKFNREKGLVAWFFADSDGAVLSYGWIPTLRDSGLGVRFKRRISKNKKEKK